MRREMILVAALTTLAACSSGGIQHYSTYDLNRDGVMDAVCPGMEYDVDSNRLYSWKNRSSDDCYEQGAQGSESYDSEYEYEEESS